MYRSNKGISLITLVITIVVIIILASITLFYGMNTPNNANLGKFVSEFSDFNLAIDNAYLKETSEDALNGELRTDAEVYYKIATGKDANGNLAATGEVDFLGNILPSPLNGKRYYRITNDTNVHNWKEEKQYFASNEAHYITDKGEGFVLPGYLVEKNGEQQWWINEKKYYTGDPIYGGNNNTIGELVEKELLKEGDMINYFPNTGDGKYIVGTDLSVGTEPQTLYRTENVNWQILDIDTEKQEILISPTDAVNTDTKFKLAGIPGYKNGEKVLHDICENLYSYESDSLTLKARSITADDIFIVSTKKVAFYPRETPADKLLNVGEYEARAHKTSFAKPYLDYRFWYIDDASDEQIFNEIIDGVEYQYAKPIIKDLGYDKEYLPVLLTSLGDADTKECFDRIGGTVAWIAKPYGYAHPGHTNFGLLAGSNNSIYRRDLAYSTGRVYENVHSYAIMPVVSISFSVSLEKKLIDDDYSLWEIID